MKICSFTVYSADYYLKMIPPSASCYIFIDQSNAFIVSPIAIVFTYLQLVIRRCILVLLRRLRN